MDTKIVLWNYDFFAIKISQFHKITISKFSFFNSDKVDFFRIYLENGKLFTKWNLGSGTGVLEGAQAIKIGKWYYVSINRAEKYGTMSINGNRSSGQSPGSFTGFDFEHIALIGGGFSFPSYFGCLLDMSINGNRIDFGMLESEGLSSCNSNWPLNDLQMTSVSTTVS